MQILGLPQALKTVTKIHKQIPFAASQALNDTARDVQQFTVKSLLPAKFTLRAKGAPWWKPGTKYGFNIRPFATKAKLEAVIGSQFEPMKLQEKGGAKTTAGHRLAIPTLQHKPKAALMVRAKKPKAMRARGAFEAKGAMWRRVGKSRLPIVRLFTLKPSARIKPVLQYEKQGMALAQKVYVKHFDKRLLTAIVTAK